MNPNSTGPVLTLDETIRLAMYLAERGHTEALFSVVGALVRVALDHLPEPQP